MPFATLGAVTTTALTHNTLTLTCASGEHLAITALTPFLFRVRLAPTGDFAPRRPWAVNTPNDAFDPIPLTLDETPTLYVLRTGGVEVRIQRNPCRLRFTTPEGRTFFADADGHQHDPETGQRALDKTLAPGERLYGFGQRGGPLLDRRGRTMTNWTVDPPWGHHANTDPMYVAIPVYLSAQPGLAFGVYLNNTHKSRFHAADRALDRLTITTDGGELDYYLAYGPTPAQVVQRLTAITGRPPLPPRWSLGYHQSRWGYKTESDVLAIAQELRGRAIPADVIHLDIDYMRGYRVFTFDPDRFPDPVRLIRTLRKQGFRIVPIIDPGVKVDPDYPVYTTGLEQDTFIHAATGEIFEGYVWPDRSVWPDFSRPTTRDWWATHQSRLTQIGITGIWNDMNEPTVFSRAFSEGIGTVGTIPEDAPQGPDDARTTHAELHNLYANHMVEACYTGLRRDLPNERPFILTRAAFAGIQRHSAVWMGDNTAWWEHLEMSVPQLINMGLSGVPFTGVDIGGFAALTTPELYARWVQLGAFYPFARGHAAWDTNPKEPWAFGPEVEAVARLYLQLRYQLLPYLYSLFDHAARTGEPILRPLFYHFPTDERTYPIHDQCLFGPHILIAPVTRPAATHRHLYLPAGQWTHWWTRQRFTGPADILIPAPLLEMPIFIREGAIFPLAELGALHTGQVSLTPLTLEIYPGNGEFTLYEDDGLTYNHESGDYARTHFTVRRENNFAFLDIKQRDGHYALPDRQLVLNVHHVSEAAGRIAATFPDTTYDSHTATLTMRVDDDGTARTLRFEL